MILRRLLLMLLVMMSVSLSAKPRKIRSPFSPIHIECTQGNAPQLPWRVWVAYTDGTAEWRQVRWDNSQLEVEQQEAELPAGSRYTVKGHIIGDNTTSQGFPIEAQVTVVNAGGNSACCALHSALAEPLPLSQVRLTGDNVLTQNRDRDIQHLLSLDVSQQLYNYRDTYGLPTAGYTEADGWDSPTIKLKGHGTGHYLSALAMAFASATETWQRDSLRARMQRMVGEMRQCQERTFVWNDSLGRYWEARDYAPDEELQAMKGTWAAFDEYKQDWQHYGYGYLNAIPAAHPALIECFRAYNNEEWVWAPYYTIHKQLAGLIDVANLIDDRATADKALLIARDMGLWVWNRLHYRTTAEQRKRMWNMYIAGEVGGMSESLARLSEMVQDAGQSRRLLEAASYFDAPAFYTPLSRNIDDIRTRHANQHIPMVTGALRCFRAGGKTDYYRIAHNFWNLVQGRYAYSTGGVGNGEMFRQPYTQMLSMNTHPSPEINETCCAYNLAKLTKDLNCFTPDDASLMDYYERVLMNQITGSLAPDRWAVTYQYAVGLNAQKPYGNETPQSTCCGGTGVENHVKYQEAAYFQNDSCLWVCLYMPTEVKADGILLTQACEYPAEKTTLTFHQGTRAMAVKLRVPYWATDGFRVKLNGKTLCKRPQPGSYFEIPRRQWQEGDRIDIDMPYPTHLCFGPDKVDGEWLATVMHGPLAMATDEVKTWEESRVTEKQLKKLHFRPDNTFSTPSTRYLRMAGEHAVAPDTTTVATTTIHFAKELAELEELLVRRRETAQPQHVQFAEMVIRYVKDGSGTRDMIDRAVRQLKE